MEVWKDISGFENYQISNYGNVKSLNYGRTGKTGTGCEVNIINEIQNSTEEEQKI